MPARVQQISPLAARQRAYSPFICPSVPPSSLLLPVFPPPNPPLRLGRLLFAAAVTDPLLLSVEAAGGDVSLVPAGDEMCLARFIHRLVHCFPPPCADPKKLALTPSSQFGNRFCTEARLSPGLK